MTTARTHVRHPLAALLVAALTASLLALSPPAPARAAQLSTTFSGDAPGAAPAGWTSRWANGWWAVQDNPSRLVHAGVQTVRTLLAWDAPGQVDGDVEVSAVVQIPADNAAAAGGSRFQLLLHATGEQGSETGYFLEQGGNNLRLGQYSNGAQTTNLAQAGVPGGVSDHVWYQVVFARQGNTLRAKMWRLGAAEPDAWLLTANPSNPLPASGRVGIGNRSAGTNPAYSDFAFFGVGTAGDAAPRAPGDLVPQAPAPSAPVPGVAVDQQYGFTTVRWDADPALPLLLTQYQVLRVPVDANDQPTGNQQVVGIWRFNRYTYTGAELTFADAGYVAGGRYGWAVRAVTAAGTGPASAWVYGDTLRAPTPDEALRTGFEQNITQGNANWTTYEEEVAFTEAVDAASERVRVEVAGQTHLGRNIYLWVFGPDKPPASPADNDKPVVLLNCLVHGPEPGGREACMMLGRELAFSDDPWVLDVLTKSQVIIVPVINGDGRALNQRGNARGNQDLNRDHSLLREPETRALARVMRDWQPNVAIDGHHYGDANVGDLPLLWARNHLVEEGMHDFTRDHVTLGRLFSGAASAGWWPQPYPIGYSEETILRNTLGLKSIAGVLLESRSAGGPTRPAEGTAVANRQRHVYSHLWTYRELLDYHAEHGALAEEVKQAAEAWNSANLGPLVLDGARSTPRYSPPDRPTSPSAIIPTPPCGYSMTWQQYTETAPYPGDYEHFGPMPSAQTRLAEHGVDVWEYPDGRVFVPLGQPLRGLIALILDPAAPGQAGLPGSYEGPFLFSGDAQRVQGCPAPPPPTDVEQCKNGGWAIFTEQGFRNQGQCVAFVASGAPRPPAHAGAPGGGPRG